MNKFTYLKFETENQEIIKFGYKTYDTRVTPVVVSYQLVGLYTSSLFSPVAGNSGLETLQFVFNTCTEQAYTEPDIIDYLSHRYIGGDTSDLNSWFSEVEVSEVEEELP